MPKKSTLSSSKGVDSIFDGFAKDGIERRIVANEAICGAVEYMATVYTEEMKADLERARRGEPELQGPLEAKELLKDGDLSLPQSYRACKRSLLQNHPEAAALLYAKREVIPALLQAFDSPAPSISERSSMGSLVDAAKTDDPTLFKALPLVLQQLENQIKVETLRNIQSKAEGLKSFNCTWPGAQGLQKQESPNQDKVL